MNDKSVRQVVDTIFEYDDYRAFLCDYFKAKKSEKPAFSQRYFAQKAGFKAHNFCSLVLQSRRNLSTDSIQKISRTVGLKGKAAAYFETLVYLNQATSIEDKESYFSRLKQIGKNTRFHQVHQKQFFFYEKWYYPVIRELLVMKVWDDDFYALAKAVRPPITTQQACEAVRLLTETGMVQRDSRGHYVLTDKFVTSAGVPDYIKKKSRRDVLLKGIETIDQIDSEEKYTSYATVSMSKQLYLQVRGILDEARQKILTLVDNDDIGEEVYEVVLQAFPVSNMKVVDKKVASGGNHREK